MSKASFSFFLFEIYFHFVESVKVSKKLSLMRKTKTLKIKIAYHSDKMLRSQLVLFKGAIQIILVTLRGAPGGSQQCHEKTH